MRFFVGMDDVHHAGRVGPAFISVNRLRGRRSPFDVGDWVMGVVVRRQVRGP